MTFDASLSISQRYAKALCHLNHARRSDRLGLILGSGVSDELKIPKWVKLIEQIDSKLNYNSKGSPESYRAEQLFQHYKKKETDELGSRPIKDVYVELIV